MTRFYVVEHVVLTSMILVAAVLWFVSFMDVVLIIFVSSFQIPCPDYLASRAPDGFCFDGWIPRKASFSKQKAPSLSALTLQLTPNVNADIGGMTLQNGFVSTLSSASQLDERISNNDVTMHFMGPLCRQSPPEWVQEYILMVFLVVLSYNIFAPTRTRTPRI